MLTNGLMGLLILNLINIYTSRNSNIHHEERIKNPRQNLVRDPRHQVSLPNFLSQLTPNVQHA